MNKVKKPALGAVFLLTALLLTNAVFVKSVSGNKGAIINPDFAYSEPQKETPETLGYLVESPETQPFSLENTIESTVILPGAVKASNLAIQEGENTQNPFIMPTLGFNWGELHDKNAVDIANYCGAPVFAAASGVVVQDEDYTNPSDSWQGGYGLFVLIEHPGNIKTRYAHLSRTSVEIADYVKQGSLIGYVGATGNVHGITGCHLHFEVFGAENPFAKH